MSFWKPGNMAADQPNTNDRSKKQEEEKGKPAKTKLSQKLLAMKFMQRKAAETVAQIEQTEKDAEAWEIQDANTYESGAGAELVFVQGVDSSINTEMGRRSFGGFNKNVEREYESIRKSKKYIEEEERELREEISAEEMAERMQKYVGRKQSNQGGRQRKKQRLR